MKEVFMFAVQWLAMMLLVALLCFAARVIGKFLGNGKSKDKTQNNDINTELTTSEDKEPTGSDSETIVRENAVNKAESEPKTK